MTDSLHDYSTIRLTIFLLFFLILAISETASPRRRLSVSKIKRWRVNFSIMLLDTLLIRSITMFSPIVIAAWSEKNGWGFFNLIGLGGFKEILATVLLLDLIIYFQHRIFHRVPLLWRLHRTHHTDLDLDVSSGNRFHPFEMLISIFIKTVAVITIGCSPFSVLLFEIVLNSTSMFNHSNLNIAVDVDKLLRYFIVTPDMHRVHHSVIQSETDSNFSFSLPWWDRIFGTYRPQPKMGHESLTIGLREYRELEKLGFWQLLKNPFNN